MAVPLKFPTRSPRSICWKNALLGTRRNISVADADGSLGLSFEPWEGNVAETSLRIPLSFGDYRIDIHPNALPHWDSILQGTPLDALPDVIVLALAMEQIEPALRLLEALLESSLQQSDHASTLR